METATGSATGTTRRRRMRILQAAVSIAVLIFRTLPYAVLIPLGRFPHVIWRMKKSWLDPPDAGELPMGEAWATG